MNLTVKEPTMNAENEYYTMTVIKNKQVIATKDISRIIIDGDFSDESVEELYDDICKGELFDFLMGSYEKDVRQCFADEADQKDFFVEMFRRESYMRIFYQEEFTQILLQLDDEE